ncbi:unnamed protein product [Parascedosporium putredinis]|uniref:Ribonuclease H2 subunit B n=1 Tax=Parascedosporium putredinis TaxID=1442378 RepID=A0A9P1HC43_9PEZI|nr:unnamed protein product [Parascedosporium putredinis]CAI8004541.1 unnamed protein product [Parascedosporium putredinis]
MARTRASKPAAADAESAQGGAEATSIYTLPPRVRIPPTPSSSPCRLLRGQDLCPESGVYEFTQISAPSAAPRSWLFEQQPTTTQADDADETTTETKPKDINGYISKSADLFIATPFDPLFLVIPALLETAPKSDAKRLFLASDDHLEKLPEDDSHLNEILRNDETRGLFESRMKAVCDTVEAGSEVMFRINEEKLFRVILGKAKKLAECSLPPSMEEKFVAKVLQAPMIARVRRDIPTAASGTSTPLTESAESQASTATAESNGASAASQASTAATSVAEEPAVAEEDIATAMQASPEVLALQRLRVAFDFICGSYIPVRLVAPLKEKFSDKAVSGTDFAPLDDYLTELAKIRAEAVAVRGGTYGRKHGREEDEDVVQQEKKRKLEEEKKKKAMESRGVRDLKKVDTTGMKN